MVTSMPNDPVSHEEYKGRCDLCDERFARDKQRLSKLEDAFEVTSKLDVKLGLIVEQLQKGKEQHEQRISSLEQKPARRWELVVTTLIASMVGGVAGFVIALVKAGVGS